MLNRFQKYIVVVFALMVTSFGLANAKEFMSAKEISALQSFQGKSVIEKGDPAHGRTLYTFYCTPCHGMAGKGDGLLAKQLNPEPRNHTDGAGKRAGDGMNDRTDDQLFNAITKGGQGINKSVNMPAWGHIISEKGRWDIVSYLRTIAVPPYVPKGKK